MKKNRVELDRETIGRIVTLAQEERKPFEEIKKAYALGEKEVTEIMRKELSADNFELWKKKIAAKKPKPRPVIMDDFDELDSKYYFRHRFG